MKVYTLKGGVTNACSFTPAGGSEVVIDDVLDIDIAHNADIRTRGSDGDLWQTLCYAENFRIEGSVNTTNISLVHATAGLRPGTVGVLTLTFPLKAMGSGPVASVGIKVVTAAGSTVLGSMRTSAAHAGQDSRLGIPFTAISADGSASPLTYSLV